ncbi:hypothetical protein RRV45_01220 [Bacillus sp. DTU_2020_1000418_1_SI_GHA_SEK_038]|uniref:hypothetical protein n=1 Tax=Bacillus sp. DTU_2020_1000418_1_SI_GHA_SEK_038 TaxID=3077585 RepID=UPI0028E856A5|nr:hypothetical protein [Bacillus sp. DTU_2020_1000418_1_SI_GHA_SEK_038]WNS75699.1 hypothetical protein RRV45_01220 [Bacillus sp. DTU_2020_1000418_1_SI_GHA_SEK_038]
MSIFSLIKPLRKYEDFFYRAYTYESLFLRKKAIQIMNSALKQTNFSKEEKSSGLIYLGMLYTKTKEYKLASDCYNQGLEIMINESFKYSNNFKQAIEAFIKNEDFERAKFWLNNLIQRQSFDKKFKKLAIFEKKVY